MYGNNDTLYTLMKVHLVSGIHLVSIWYPSGIHLVSLVHYIFMSHSHYEEIIMYVQQLCFINVNVDVWYRMIYKTLFLNK